MGFWQHLPIENWSGLDLCFAVVPFLSRGHVIENSHLNFIQKTLREKNKNTVGAIQKHCGSVNALPQCFEKWNMKLKMKHESCMFHFLKWLIFNKLKHKNETWKINQRFWKRMDICKRIRDASIYTSKKIAQVLFLSDIFLFPFIWQQFPVLT